MAVAKGDWCCNNARKGGAKALRARSVDLQNGSRQKLRRAKIFVDGRQEAERRKEGKRKHLSTQGGCVRLSRGVWPPLLVCTETPIPIRALSLAVSNSRNVLVVAEQSSNLGEAGTRTKHQATTIAIAVEAREGPLEGKRGAISDAGNAGGAPYDAETFLPRFLPEAGAGAPSCRERRGNM